MSPLTYDKSILIIITATVGKSDQPVRLYARDYYLQSRSGTRALHLTDAALESELQRLPKGRTEMINALHGCFIAARRKIWKGKYFSSARLNYHPDTW